MECLIWLLMALEHLNHLYLVCRYKLKSIPQCLQIASSEAVLTEVTLSKSLRNG